MSDTASTADAALQRRKDAFLAATRSAERQLENALSALHDLDPESLKQAGLPVVNFHDLMDAQSGLAAAWMGVRKAQEMAERMGAER